MSEERFARQYLCGPPAEFLLPSTCTSIVHHLSGPNIHAQARSVSPGGSQTADHVTMCMIQSISLRTRVYNSNTRTYVRLLGPCFKTGRMTTPWWRQDAERAERRTSDKSLQLSREANNTGSDKPPQKLRSNPPESTTGQQAQRAETWSIRSGHCTSMVCHSLSPNDFTYF